MKKLIRNSNGAESGREAWWGFYTNTGDLQEKSTHQKLKYH